MKHWVDTYPHEIHASVILKENKIKIWKVGQRKLSDKYQIEPLVRDRPDYGYQENTWIVNSSEEHNNVFKTLSTDWFRQWGVSEEIQGSSPFENDFMPQAIKATELHSSVATEAEGGLK